MMKPINIYMCGVGGQGIGMLSELISRACLNAGLKLNGCDTHGLAQRGGTVVSHLRLGEEVFTPRVPDGQANLVVSLERLEAWRAADRMLKEKGLVVFYDAVYQPIHLRTGAVASYPSNEDLAKTAEARGGNVERVFIDGLDDPRMQNVAILGKLAALKAIEGVSTDDYKKALLEIMPAKALESNMNIFNSVSQS